MYVIVVYFYFFVCLLILLYTVGYALFQWYDRGQQQKIVQKYVHLIVEKGQLCSEDRYTGRAHLEELYIQLKPTKQLIAFERALSQLKKENRDVTAYLIQIEPVIKNLTKYYQRRNQMEQAYFAWFIATHAKDRWQDPLIYQTLISFMDNSTIYLRENILQATYQQPNVKWIVHAYQKLTTNHRFHHPKLIQDGLLQFPYDDKVLMERLWDKRSTFHPSIVQGVIGFITYKSDDYKEAFYELLTKEQLDLELTTRLIRYFKNHHYPEMENLLQSMATDSEDTIRIVVAQVLSAYPSPTAIATLKEALKDANWHVRYNASQSLLKMDVSRMDVLDVVNGQDAYAKEMLHYHLHEEGKTDVLDVVSGQDVYVEEMLHHHLHEEERVEV